MNVNMNHLYSRITVLILATVSTGATPLYYNVTANGNSKGAPCVFPFFYNGSLYYECTSLNYYGLWCSTTDNYDRDRLWGECLDSDVCLSYKNLSDPWRNVGFNRTSFSAWPMNDLNLQEGWYRFTGIGGDRMVHYCLEDSVSDDSNAVGPNDSESSADVSEYTCDNVTGCTWSLDCGGGLILYYLVPFSGVYITCHSSCSAASCGMNVHCNDGSCVCDSGLSTPIGFLTSGDSDTCSDYQQILGEKCKDNCSVECAVDLLRQAQSIPAQVMSENVVAEYLNEEMSCMKAFEDVTTDEDGLMRFGNSVLKATEKLVSGLVMKTDTYFSTGISLQTLEVQVFVVGPKASLRRNPLLSTSNAYLYIGLIGISRNQGSAAVALISYTNLSNILTSRFNTTVSTVVSVTLLDSNVQLSKPFTLILKHTTVVDPTHSASFCVTWEDNKWVKGSCNTIWTSDSYTVCSCHQPATYTVINEQFTKDVSLGNNCKVNCSVDCALDLQNQILSSSAEVIPEKVVKEYLKRVFDCMRAFKNTTTDQLVSYWNSVLNATEKLVTGLVMNTDTNYSTNISLKPLEVQVFVVGPNASLSVNPQLNTTNAFLDIDLIGIAKNNNGSAAVAVMNYIKLWNNLKLSFSTVTSTAVSVTLLNTPNTHLSQPFNITLKHTTVVDSAHSLSFCVTWEDSKWVEGSCSVIQTNDSYTVCSCHQPAMLTVVNEWFTNDVSPLRNNCKVNCSVDCALDLQNQILNSSAEVIPEKVVKEYLKRVFDCIRAFKNTTTDQLVSYWNSVLNATEKLVTGLVMNTDTNYSTNISLKPLEVQVFVVGPNASLTVNPQLNTTSAFLDIDLIGIANNNNGSAAVAVMNYIKLWNNLKPSFSTMTSTAVSVTLLNTPNTHLSQPFNITLKHTTVVDSAHSLSFCVTWEDSKWVEGSCSVIQTNDSYTVCSCHQPAMLTVVNEWFTNDVSPLRNNCKVNCSVDCALDLQNQILSSSAEVIPEKVVKEYLKREFDCMRAFKNTTTDQLVSYWNSVLNATEKLVTGLVMNTDTNYSTNISLKPLEVQVFVVGPNASLSVNPQLNTTNAFLDIDLIGIANNNNGSAAVAVMNYIKLSNDMKSSFSTMTSTAVSVTLLNTPNTHLSQPFNITLKHTTVVDSAHSLSFCVTWEDSKWVEGSCSVIQTNDSYTVCSCHQPAMLTVVNEWFTNDFSPLRNNCKVNCSVDCALDLQNQILNSSAEVIPEKVVKEYLKREFNCMKALKNTTTEQRMSYWNSVLNATEKLVTGLVMNTDTNYSTNISLKPLEVQVFVVGPNASLPKNTWLNTSSDNLNIDLIGIAKNNNGSAAVGLISYINISKFLKTNFTVVSNVVSVTLLNTTNRQLSKPFKLYLNYTTDKKVSLSCMTWKETEWVGSNCRVSRLNNSYVLCSCNYSATFAIISVVSTKSSYLGLLTTVAKSVAVVFLALTLLTFALCRHQPNTKNTTQVNLCISLMLTHILFLLRGRFRQDMRNSPPSCAVVAGVLHFLYLSAFMWMFIDAVLLLISVKNLTKIRSRQRAVLGRKGLMALGYGIPLVTVGVSAAVVPDGYGDDQCWLKVTRSFSWSFLGPLCFIFSLNLILFIAIFVLVASTLRSLNAETSQRIQTLADKKVVTSVLLKTLAQFVILGCPWLLYIFISKHEVVYVLYEVFISLQAILIYLIQCVLNQEVRQQYRRWAYTICPCITPASFTDAHITEGGGTSRLQTNRVHSRYDSSVR